MLSWQKILFISIAVVIGILMLVAFFVYRQVNNQLVSIGSAVPSNAMPSSPLGPVNPKAWATMSGLESLPLDGKAFYDLPNVPIDT